MDVRPPLVKLTADVLGAGLHHRVGHQVAELGLVPVLAERVDVGNGEKTLRGVGQERFAGAASGPCNPCARTNSNTLPTHHDRQVKKRGTAQLLVSIGTGIIYLIGKVTRD